MTENNNISGVEAIRQLIEAQKNWHVFRAKKENNKNTIYIGGTALTEEELISIKAGGQMPSEGLTYELSEDKTYAICTGLGTCRDTDLVIAASYQGMPVKSIGSEAFDGGIYNSVFVSVKLPETITTIDSSAFFRCASLTSINIPDSVTSIGSSAFYYCSSLECITIPDSVTSIGEYAFESCANLTIYCEAAEQPVGWNADWNPDNRPVVWGAALDLLGVNEKISQVNTAIETLQNEFGDIESALDAIITIQNELMGIITFTIDSTECVAEEGMTWLEWCNNRDYHTMGIYCDTFTNRVIGDKNGISYYVKFDNKQVLPNEPIVAGRAYVLA